MARLTVVYWRDIPTQVIVKEGRQAAKRPLDYRFHEAVDRAAMHAGLYGTDDYLGEWRRSEPEACGDDLEAEADAALARIEAAYDDARLNVLVATEGREPAND